MTLEYPFAVGNWYVAIMDESVKINSQHLIMLDKPTNGRVSTLMVWTHKHIKNKDASKVSVVKRLNLFLGVFNLLDTFSGKDIISLLAFGRFLDAQLNNDD